MTTYLSRPTIRDIASGAGVSIATVSRVLNGRPDVAPETRERVLQHIRANGFASNRSARNLAGGRTGLIALTVPFMHPEYFAQIVEGAAEALYERDARFVLCPTMHQHDREVTLLERVMHGSTDGAVLILPSETDAELHHLLAEEYPFVVVDPETPVSEDVPVVAAANTSGARSAVEHLLTLGHERIGVITGRAGGCATVDRLAGYHSALVAAGISVEDALLEEGDYSVDSGYRAGAVMLDRPRRPTAIFAFNDNMAVGTIWAARERGLAVPGDLSVVGFDDAELASVITPSLTTVRQPLEEMGRVSAGLLFRRLDGQSIDAARLELSTRLVVRDSTATPA